jgi:hypothetical protein
MSEKGLFQHNPPEAAIQAIKWQHIGHAHAITSSKQLGIIGDRAIEDQAMIEHPRDALRPALRQKMFRSEAIECRSSREPGTLDETGWLQPDLLIWMKSAQGWVPVPGGVKARLRGRRSMLA